MRTSTPADPAEAKRWLIAFANQLKTYMADTADEITPYIEHHLAKYVTDGIDKAVREKDSSEVVTLDHAFGLIGKVGKRVSPENYDLAKRAYQLKYRDGKALTWTQVSDALDSIHTANLDGDELKKLVHRNIAAIQADFAKIEAADLVKELQDG